MKMCVNNATNVMSHDVSFALELLADKIDAPKLKTISWFVGIIVKWFQIMTNREVYLALENLRSEKYVEVINFLWEIVELLSSLKVGETGNWKPFQTGVIISTVSTIEVTAYLLQERDSDFVLLDRFTCRIVPRICSVHCAARIARSMLYNLNTI